MCVPASDISAGSSVMAARTAVATAIAAVYPRAETSGMPATASDTSATTTVHPANVTAVPAVPTARAIDSCISMPSRSCVRCRVTRKSA